MPLSLRLLQGLLAQAKIQPQNLPDPAQDPTLRVNVESNPYRMASPDPLKLPADLSARNPLQYQPATADLPSMSMPAQEALSQKMDQYPTFGPGFGSRLVSSLAAGSEGYARGPMAGLQTGQAYLRAPYQEKVERFNSQAVPLMHRAGVESDNFKRSLERAKMQSELGIHNTKNMVDVENANSRMDQEGTRRENAQTAAQQANTRLFGLNQPNFTFKETAGTEGGVPNEIVGFDTKSHEVKRTGVEGQGKWRSLEDLKDLIGYRYKEFGKMLRDIPQRDVFSSIENSLRMEGIRNPQIYGKFFGPDGYILPPTELKRFTSPEDVETIRRLFDAALTKSKEAVTKSKDLKRGIVNPNQILTTPGGNTILNPNDDDVPSTNDEEQ